MSPLAPHLLPHLLVVPVVLPLLTAALLLLLGEKRGRLRSLVNLSSTAASLAAAVMILRRVDGGGGGGEIGVYLAANWEAPFGIILVADRLAALMLVLTGVVSLCAALYAEAGWARASVYFHPLFQIQLMGLGGAFLTGDLFNLFVFFEVTLAASYGLQLHGSGWPRVRSGLHYIAVNLLASSLFLVGVSVLYGVLGTLSMADIAEKMALVPERDRGILLAGVAILSMAFLIKAAIWPVNGWLVPAYAAASAPVAALFSVMTKLGIYTLVRLWMLFFSAGAVLPSGFGRSALLFGGFATVAYGILGLLGALRLGRIAAFSIIVSSGTLLTALGVGTPPVLAAALYYLPSAALSGSALFLLVELSERIGSGGQPRAPATHLPPGDDTNLDEEALPLVGRMLPISTALLGLLFMACGIVLSGLPPLSGFVAKFSLLRAVVASESGVARWMIFGLVLGSGLATLIALARAGIRRFWSAGAEIALRLKGVEAVAVLVPIACCVALTVWAEPVMRYARAAARTVHEPKAYIEAVKAVKARPGPARSTDAGDGSP